MSKSSSSLIFGFAIVISSIFLGNAYVERNQSAGEISVTGLGKADFSSDLIVWEGRFGAMNRDLKTAYKGLKDKKKLIQNYLINKGLDENDLVFSAVQTSQRTKRVYSNEGDYMGEEFVGYELNQSISIESKDVDRIEKVSREVTELLNQGVEFYSDAPRYYYTQLANLKIEMISKATEDARVRAENIASNAGGELGDLQIARMGVFQITGQNSKEDYSWGGTYNTSSREKTASITMKLVYNVE